MEIYGRLLDQGLEVYIPVMYIRHDCVVRTTSDQHIDVEIKSRVKPEGTTFQLGKGFKPRLDLFVVLHYIGTNDTWVLPSDIAEKICLKGASGKQIKLNQKLKENLQQYKNAYQLILGSDS